MANEQEPNSTSANANALTLGAAMTGQLALSTDVDWYRFTAASAGLFTIVLDVPTSVSSEYFRVSFIDASNGALLNIKPHSFDWI